MPVEDRTERKSEGTAKGLSPQAERGVPQGFSGAWRVCGKQLIADAMAKYPDVLFYVCSTLVPADERSNTKPMIDDDMVLAARFLAARSEVNSAAIAERPSSGEHRAPVDGEENRLSLYRPYPKQREFHAAGAEHDERLLIAGNQLGKTLAGGMEWAMHLTGRYPDWWTGRVFDAPVHLLASGVTAESTRDDPQRILLGPPQQREKWGTGTIPRDALKDWTLSQVIGDGVDSVVVRWGGGGGVQPGESILAFKSYEKGRQKWQGETLDGVWFDEEPPLDIYSEERTRCQVRRGAAIVTFTPLLEMTDVVKLFLGEADLARVRRTP